MKKPHTSVDGFIPRRPGNQLGELHANKAPEQLVSPIDRSLHTGVNTAAEQVGAPRTGKIMATDGLTESLRAIDEGDKSEPSKKSKRKGRPRCPTA